MSDIIFITDEDSGEGSLRDVISNSSPGDVIMPSPDLFIDGVCTVFVSDPMPNLFMRRSFSSGGNGKVVLDGSYGTKLTNTTSTTYNVYGSYEDIVFQNFSNDATSAGNGALFCYYVGNLSFTRCAFYDNSCGYRGVINIPSSTGYIDFTSCVSSGNTSGNTSYGGLLTMLGTGTVSITGCTFGEFACRFGINVPYTVTDSLIRRYYADGGNIYNDFTNDVVDYANRDFRLVEGSQYETGATVARIDYAGNQVNIGGSIGAYQYIDTSTKWWRFSDSVANTWDITSSVIVNNIWYVDDIVVDQEF